MRLVIELHYTDGDVGAYPIEGDLAKMPADALWALFSPPQAGHAPEKIVVRLAEQDE
jgi:hypothetical protein